jgi:lysozyme family protein
MADFDKAIIKTLEHEGGATYTNDPDDPGGETKYGISKRAHPTVDIKNLTEAEAKAIYKRDYWNPIRGDDINSQLVAENIFDTAVNMGNRTASRLAQMALEIEPVDGIIGPQTLGVINKANEEIFILKYTIAKIARYAHICNRRAESRKYLLGWINRTLGAM